MSGESSEKSLVFLVISVSPWIFVLAQFFFTP